MSFAMILAGFAVLAVKLRWIICVYLRDLRAVCDVAMKCAVICVHLCDLWAAAMLRWDGIRHLEYGGP